MVRDDMSSKLYTVLLLLQLLILFSPLQKMFHAQFFKRKERDGLSKYVHVYILIGCG